EITGLPTCPCCELQHLGCRKKGTTMLADAAAPSPDASRPKPRVLVARRVPPAVAERAQREFDAVLAETDMDADAVITAASAHGRQGIFSRPQGKPTGG